MMNTRNRDVEPTCDPSDTGIGSDLSTKAYLIVSYRHLEEGMFDSSIRHTFKPQSVAEKGKPSSCNSCGDRKNMRCSNCGKFCHRKVECFPIIGFPEG